VTDELQARVMLICLCLMWGGSNALVWAIEQAGFAVPRWIHRYLTICAVSIVIFAAFVLTACTSKPTPVQTIAVSDPSDAVVILLCERASGEEVSRVPCCNAFAARAGPGVAGVRLYTAAHCVREARVGDDVRYVSRELWARTAKGSASARVVLYDSAHDRAALTPVEYEDAQALITFALTRAAPDEGRPDVSAVCAWSGWESERGEMLARVDHLWPTTIDVVPGWSGSPALDTQGRAIGIMIACAGVTLASGTGDYKGCAPRSGIFVDLAGLE